MHIKDLFAVPEGKNISEKMFGRVLLSSVCSILLCTACLVGTTWAWFTVEVKSAESSIVIGEPEAVVFSQLMRPSAEVSGIPSFSFSYFNASDEEYKTANATRLPLERQYYTVS